MHHKHLKTVCAQGAPATFATLPWVCRFLRSIGDDVVDELVVRWHAFGKGVGVAAAAVAAAAATD
eukprot:9628616-Alexandrium_andersonii.AAC.1